MPQYEQQIRAEDVVWRLDAVLYVPSRFVKVVCGLDRQPSPATDDWKGQHGCPLVAVIIVHHRDINQHLYAGEHAQPNEGSKSYVSSLWDTNRVVKFLNKATLIGPSLHVCAFAVTGGRLVASQVRDIC
ncbi:hypothetical protein ACJ73_07687 [Blastomyces percursus]|uniref:Uncharacterized protein n=1 Tax=Blastomyces percursus TaxID=1658174 RepID=A0A1J9PXD0_9EURO|nr:hypothetical protein ACJ73_07687 [Blastomyces percursus]